MSSGYSGDDTEGFAGASMSWTNAQDPRPPSELQGPQLFPSNPRTRQLTSVDAGTSAATVDRNTEPLAMDVVSAVRTWRSPAPSVHDTSNRALTGSASRSRTTALSVGRVRTYDRPSPLAHAALPVDSSEISGCDGARFSAATAVHGTATTAADDASTTAAAPLEKA
ncbi:hypothetical protein ACIOTI_33815 [Streptomyces sp. NPDC087843]|uniref:hypothetical protein n=1 Tax=Streptomyces sp. NPDC087843 TaxID=3365804 RepID=UPI00381C6B67